MRNWIIALCVLCLTAGYAVADTENLSVQLDTELQTSYFFRGINQQDSGVIVQPSLTASYVVNEDLIITGQFFNSFHSDGEDTATTGSGGIEAWYEARFAVGAEYALDDDWTTGVAYTAYTSPNDSFNTIHELSASVSYDRLMFGDVNLNPTAMVAFELDGARDGDHEGIYAEIGIRPEWQLIDGDQPVDLAVPVVVGFSLDNYYGDSIGYAYTDVGVELTTPLNFVDGLTLTVGAHALFLSEDADDFNDGGDETEFIGTLGLSYAF